MNTRNLRKGFTLIEILVVISIIGILSAVLYANFGDARQEAKNKAMQAELKETQLAIELYKAQNGRYPAAFTIPAVNCATVSGFAPNQVATSKSSACGTNPIILGLVPEFTADLPSRKKSANSICDIEYKVDHPNGAWYKLTAVNCHGGASSQPEGVQSDDEFARCPSICTPTGSCDPNSVTFYESYAVYSAGGECKQ